ncbi:heme o synthase [Rhizobium sp. YIM 134829]|uniref:heme o synthase n=1 Tax=Rhizobium sp. YIM 134829 TaxID=3390453 RepID=UPI00397C7DCD
MAVIDTSAPLDEAPVRLSEATARDFFALLKPRVMSLVVFTAVAGMVMAPGSINPVIGFVAILCIAVGAGASGALNMWYDADIDALMRRTASRPIPAGRILPREALGFGLTLSAFSVAILGLTVNWLSAGLLAFTIFFYSVIYTMWLKRSTPQNIVIGGAAGAFPPMIGWAAVTGGVSIESIVLFLITFLWTPAHFWALALFKMKEYGAVGVPMLPNVHGIPTTKVQILIYSVLTALIGLCPTLLRFASPVYGAVALLLGAAFIWYSVLVYRMAENDQAMLPAKKLFAYSIVYLFAIFLALMVDRGAGLAMAHFGWSL